MAWTVAGVAAFLDGELLGDGSRPVRALASLRDAGPEDLSFFARPRYRDQLAATKAAAVLVGPRVSLPEREAPPAWIRVRDPHRAFAKLAREWHPEPRPNSGIDPRAACAGEASGARVMAFAFVGEGASVGEGSIVYPFVYVGAGARVGRDCVLGPGSVVMDGCVLGDRVRLAPGAVVGADGFGYAVAPEAAPGARWERVPQLGGVELSDDVDVGANATVDRAALGLTRVGAGTKLDNLVQIGHGATLGPDVAMAACSGVAGSATLGRGVVVGAGAGVLGHLDVGAEAQIGAGSMVAQDVPPGERRSGMPAIPHTRWLRMMTMLPHLTSR